MKKSTLLIIIAVMIISLVALLVPMLMKHQTIESSPKTTTNTQGDILTVVTPPDPNSVPLLLLKAYENEWLSKNGYEVNLKIKLAPSGDPSAMKALLHKKQADIGLFNNLGAAKFYAQGEKHLKLIGVHVWRGVYILTWENIMDWKQLDGKKGIAIPAIKAPPHIWAMKALKKHNVMVQFIGTRMGQVLFTTLSRPNKSVPVVVAPEPAITMILMKQKKENWPVKYKVFADPAKEINPNGVPLGAMIIVNDTFANSENGRKVIETFIEGYKKAINEVKNKGKIDNNSKILVSKWKETFNQNLPPQFFKMLLSSNRLGLNFRRSGKIKEELLKVYKEFGIKVDDGFFY